MLKALANLLAEEPDVQGNQQQDSLHESQVPDRGDEDSIASAGGQPDLPTAPVPDSETKPKIEHQNSSKDRDQSISHKMRLQNMPAAALDGVTAGITSLGSLWSGLQQLSLPESNAEEDEELAQALPEGYVDWANGLTDQTFESFPVEEFVDERLLLDNMWTSEMALHAKEACRASQVGDMHARLCPSKLHSDTFWYIYFQLAAQAKMFDGTAIAIAKGSGEGASVAVFCDESDDEDP